MEILNLENNIVIFKIKEDIMGYKVDALKEHIQTQLSKNNKNIILDLNMIDYIDSLGIGAIIKLHKQIQDDNGSFIIINMSKAIYKLITMLNIEKTLSIKENIKEAIDFFKLVK